MRVRFEPGVEATVEGQPARGRGPSRADTAGTADVVALGPLQMHRHRARRPAGVRLKDMNAETRRAFTGLALVPDRRALSGDGRFVPHARAPDRSRSRTSSGRWRRCRAPATRSSSWTARSSGSRASSRSPGAKELFFIFRDETSGKETYPAGRFLYSDLPKDGQVVLDFNKAYNPPCAFTAFATCPLPPKQNWVPRA